VTQASGVKVFCHPDDPSIARGGTDLGQLRGSEAGTGFEIAQRSLSVDSFVQRTNVLKIPTGSPFDNRHGSRQGK
jgi:hypothetical protein